MTRRLSAVRIALFATHGFVIRTKAIGFVALKQRSNES